MNIKMALISIIAILVLFVIFRRREKKRIAMLQKMVDQAISGTYDISVIDESMLSSLENTMHRFIADCTISSKTMSREKQKIQSFLSDISHQTITPISNILIYTQLLEERDRQKEYAQEVMAIQEQTEKLSFLINSLVKMSRLETGIITVAVKLVKVQDLLEAVMKQAQSKALEKDITINVEQTEAEVVCDFKWSVEALYNVVDNAIKYTAKGGRVNIQTLPYHFFCRIDIQDNGIGIAEWEYSKIFGRFYRSQNVSEVEGIGIGLYLAREIVAAQNGYMKVFSKLSEGSTFSLYLPTEK